MIQQECVFFCGPYKGYLGKAALEGDLFHGEVIGLRDVVTFQGRTPAELRKAFAESVDDYLEFCAGRQESPDKPFTGKFVTRVPPQVHRKLSENASRAGLSMNQYVVELLSKSVDENVAEFGKASSRLPKQRKQKASSRRKRA
jgi:predicted HicB family RNase H-like nuclease